MRIKTGNLNRIYEKKKTEQHGFLKQVVLPVTALAIACFLLLVAYLLFYSRVSFVPRPEKTPIIVSLQSIHKAQLIFQAQVSLDSTFGDFDDLINAKLLKDRTENNAPCINCGDVYTVNRSFQAEFRLNRSSDGRKYCVAAFTDSLKDKVMAVDSDLGIIYEGKPENIRCAEGQIQGSNIEMPQNQY